MHLVTQIRNRDAILRAGRQESIDFTVIDSEAIARPLWKSANVLRMGEGKGWTVTTAINAISYPYFEHLVWKHFGADIKAGGYDIVHRITPLTPTANSLLAARCRRAGVPFVMGPLNGGVPWPKGFDSERRREREWLSYVRGAYKLMPGRRAMLEAVAAVLVGSEHTRRDIPARYQQKCILMPENAIDPDRFNRTAAQTGTLPLRACFIGRLVPLKGVAMLLEAAAPLLRDGRMTLEIVGDGPMMTDLQAQAQRLLEGHALPEPAVIFYGRVPHDKVQDILAECHLLTFPSIREFGGGVVLEAMALGVVPVVADYGGPGELVGPGMGFRIPMGTRDEIISRLRKTLEEIAADPAPLRIMGQAAQAHALGQFTWSAKARQVAEVYDWVLGRRADRPLPFPDQPTEEWAA